MYQLETDRFGTFNRYTLFHASSGQRFSLCPEAGATLLTLHLNRHDLLDGCSSPEELADNAAGKSSLLFPFPNRLDSGRYEWAGKWYEFPQNDPATGNAIHGFVRDMVFEVDNIVLAKDYAAITCSHHYSGQLAYYPFPFQFDVEYTIYNHGVFRLKAEVRNLHHFDIPVGFGWHPYFRLAPNADETKLKKPEASLQVVDERMLPTGDEAHLPQFQTANLLGDMQLDNAFKVNEQLDRYEVVLGGQNNRLAMRLSRAEFPYYMVFTPSDRKTVALEPMTCNMNAFNNQEGLIVLPPDGLWTGTIELKEG